VRRAPPEPHKIVWTPNSTSLPDTVFYQVDLTTHNFCFSGSLF